MCSLKLRENESKATNFNKDENTWKYQQGMEMNSWTKIHLKASPADGNNHKHQQIKIRSLEVIIIEEKT